MSLRKEKNIVKEEVRPILAMSEPRRLCERDRDSGWAWCFREKDFVKRNELGRNFTSLCPLSISEQGLEVIESTNLKYFTKEMTAEFYALKGMFLAQINKYVYCGERCRFYSCSLRILSQKPQGFMVIGEVFSMVPSAERS